MLYWLLLAAAITGVVPFIGMIRKAARDHEVARGWTSRIIDRPDGRRMHIIETNGDGRDGLLISGSSPDDLLLAFTSRGAGKPLIPGEGHLAFTTDKAARISGPAHVAVTDSGSVQVGYSNRETIPKIIRALAGSAHHFDVWASSPTWRGPRHLRIESETLKAPAAAILENLALSAPNSQSAARDESGA